jgi:drug/metabolite transporter (DMT)-like permease
MTTESKFVRKHQIDTIGALLLITCSALMGVNQVLVKIINAGLHPVFQAGLRSACAFLPVLLYALITKKTLSLTDGSFWPGILVGMFFGAEFLLLFQALDYTTVSRASIFFYTMPFWTALAAHFLIPGEKLNLQRVSGLLLAICGVVLALSINQSAASPDALIGDIFCLIGAVFWSGIIIVARTTSLSKSTPEMQLLYQLAVSAVVLLALAPYFGELVRDLNSTHVALFTFQVLVVVCFGFLIWFWVLSVYPASSMASYSFLSPVFGVFFGWLILGEQMTSTFVIALALVCVGVYLVNRKPDPRTAKPMD